MVYNGARCAHTANLYRSIAPEFWAVFLCARAHQLHIGAHTQFEQQRTTRKGGISLSLGPPVGFDTRRQSTHTVAVAYLLRARRPQTTMSHRPRTKLVSAHGGAGWRQRPLGLPTPPAPVDPVSELDEPGAQGAQAIARRASEDSSHAHSLASGPLAAPSHPVVPPDLAIPPATSEVLLRRAASSVGTATEDAPLSGAGSERFAFGSLGSSTVGAGRGEGARRGGRAAGRGGEHFSGDEEGQPGEEEGEVASEADEDEEEEDDEEGDAVGSLRGRLRPATSGRSYLHLPPPQSLQPTDLLASQAELGGGAPFVPPHVLARQEQRALAVAEGRALGS